jgi:hypothetical protein
MEVDADRVVSDGYVENHRRHDQAESEPQAKPAPGRIYMAEQLIPL